MKVIVCNTHEVKGGAAKAATRISKSLTLNDVENQYLSVQGGYASKDKNIFFRKTEFLWSRLEGYQKVLTKKASNVPFSVSKYSLKYRKYLQEYDPDIVSLHYINSGLFSIQDIGLIKRPIVWTLHDSWAFTGGCHLPLDCTRFEKKCGNCPVLQSENEKDLSRYIWNMKKKSWKDINMVIVSPSKWLAKAAKASSLFRDFRIEVIPNPLDTNIFKQFDKNTVRVELGLDKKKKYILFGAVNALKDANKGFSFLQKALRDMDIENVELLIFGLQKEETIPVNIPVHNLGFIDSEEKLAKIYSAADITVIPSISENHPNLAVESLACGTPVVGFDIEGLQEIVVDEKFGLLAKSFCTDDLRDKISQLLSKNMDSEYISKNIADRYNLRTVGIQYKKLFESIID